MEGQLPKRERNTSNQTAVDAIAGGFYATRAGKEEEQSVKDKRGGVQRRSSEYRKLAHLLFGMRSVKALHEKHDRSMPRGQRGTVVWQPGP